MDQLKTVVRDLTKEGATKVQQSLARVKNSLAGISEQISKHSDRLTSCESNMSNAISRIDALQHKVLSPSSHPHDILSSCFEEWEDRLQRKKSPLFTV